MFGLLEYPPFGYSYGFRYAPVIRRRSRFDTYVRNVQRQMERILYEGLFDLFDAPGDKEEHKDEPGEVPQQEQSEQKEKESAEKESPSERSEFFFSTSVRQTRGGAGSSERVEEHRERLMRGDGSVHTVTRRQIGDRWYVHESHSTKDGESSSKETWHNVPEEAIDSFKMEWEARNALKDEHAQAQAQPQPQQELPQEQQPESLPEDAKSEQ